ncbi:hypothetical protein SERLADRAFT_442220 [Serpula lacrymans var. lacrymans S7.9]|uniref:Uncharacterized protein n=1 Tax=Serpula lacrymans var. lacrymans (strain S7.9) TaxID=578457 RepID=F8P8T9_SERL9|nr:uncharacterized protein SERLADRAFT_442220 [Serpula lacrymans var. lacrymans S7.9]EGO20845.1 hypothetical protein SERLADRAFT_442220 [Serpula lacrymans var. lacrymans S7.9]
MSQGRRPTTRAQTRAEPTQMATPPVSSRQERTTAPPPFPQPNVTRLHTREQTDTFYKARTCWLQYYARSHPQLIPRTQHDPPVTEADVYNKNDFEEFIAEGQPIPPPTSQILPTAPNTSPIPPTSTMSNTATPKPTKFRQIDDFNRMPDRANRWMLSAKAYFYINDAIYDSDKKKVFTALSRARLTVCFGRVYFNCSDFIRHFKEKKGQKNIPSFNKLLDAAGILGWRYAFTQAYRRAQDLEAMGSDNVRAGKDSLSKKLCIPVECLWSEHNRANNQMVAGERREGEQDREGKEDEGAGDEASVLSGLTTISEMGKAGSQRDVSLLMMRTVVRKTTQKQTNIQSSQIPWNLFMGFAS